MKLPYFLAKRFSFSHQGGQNKMRLGVRIATFGVAVGLAVMIVAISVVIGFKKEVSSQVIGFGSHIQIYAYGNTYSFEKSPIEISDEILGKLKNIEGVQRVERIVAKPGVAKTQDDFKGVVFKGVERDYDWSFFEKNLVEGSLPNFSENENQVLLSKSIAKSLNLSVGDNLFAYFFQDEKIRSRKFEICGIYSSSFSDFDKMFVFCSADRLRQLTALTPASVSALEVSVSDFSNVGLVSLEIHSLLGNRFDQNRLAYEIRTINEIYPEIFSWLDMLNINAYIIIILMMIVAGFNMIAGLLILILEKTQTIGLLKAIGMQNSEIRKLFVINALFFVLKGVFWGNLVGLGLIALQYFFHIIPLNPDFYYTPYVPIGFNLWLILALNIGVLAISILIMLLPSHIITKVSPAKSIRFE